MASQLSKQVYDQRDSLQPVADAVGLKLRTATGVTREGLLPADKAGPGSAAGGPDAALLDNPRVRQALFSADVLREKQNSGVIELAPDTMLAVRVAAVEPAHVPPLDKVSETIRAKLLDERSAEAARQAGEAALAADKANPAASPEGFAGAVTVSRQDPGGLPRAVLDAIMRQPAPVARLRGRAGGRRLHGGSPGEGRARQGRAGRAREPGEPVVRSLARPRTRPWCACCASSTRCRCCRLRPTPSGRAARLGGLTPVEQWPQRRPHVIEQLGLGILVGMDAVSLEHGPVRRNAFHQEGDEPGFFVLATVGNSCAKRCV